MIHLSIWLPKKLSTDFCLSFMNKKILKGSGKCIMADMIPTDLQKVFDTIGYGVLLQKLYAISFLKLLAGLSLISPTIFLINLGNKFICILLLIFVIPAFDIHKWQVTSCQMSSLSLWQWFMSCLSTKIY